VVKLHRLRLLNTPNQSQWPAVDNFENQQNNFLGVNFCKYSIQRILISLKGLNLNLPIHE
jgi:hypothetical protein